MVCKKNILFLSSSHACYKLSPTKQLQWFECGVKGFVFIKSDWTYEELVAKL